jgi:integrase
VDWPISPQIKAVLKRVQALGKVKSSQYVIHSIDGQPYAANALLTAWKRAAVRAGLAKPGYTVKDIRAKALTDAERAGYSIEQLQVAAAHADSKTTEIYVKSRSVPVSEVRLKLPKAG